MTSPRPPRSKPPGKRKITEEIYEKLLSAFRLHGDNFTLVAQECGVHWHTAKKAWDEGWISQKSKPWAYPIKNVIKEEQARARAALQREKEALVADHRIARQKSLQEAVEASFDDIVQSRAKRGKVIRAARDNSVAALIVSQKLLKAAIPLADRIVADLNDPTLDVFQKARLLRQVGRFAHDAIEMAQVVEEMEAKALGEPSTILEIQQGVTMTVDEAKATARELYEVLNGYAEGDEIDEVIEAEWTERDQLSVPEA